MECSRDRGRGEGKDVDILPEILDLLLVGDTEALLLIDNEKSKILKGYVL